MKINQRPAPFAFAKNPVQYRFDVPEYVNDGCYLLIKVMCQPVGGSAAEIYSEQLKVISQTVYFDISDIADANLSYSIPDYSDTTIKGDNGVTKIFYIKFAVITDANPTPQWVSEAEWPIVVIKGGIPMAQWDWNNYFINYKAAQKPFFTWQPSGKFIYATDKAFISYLHTAAADDLSLLVHAYFDDSTDTSKVIDFAENDHYLYHIPCGVGQLSIAEAGKRLYKYSVTVVSKADNTIIYADPFWFYIEFRPFYERKVLHYFNSLGGIDFLPINGIKEYVADINFTDSANFHGFAVPGIAADTEYDHTSKTKVDSVKSDTGFISKKENEVVQELLLSRYAWERRNEKNFRIAAMNKATSIRKSDDKLFSMPIEWRYGFTDVVYAPDIDLGTGVDNGDYCQPVTVATPPVFPEAIKGNSYSFSFSVLGDTPITVISSTIPSWLTIGISGRTVTLAGVPDATGTVNVDFVLGNCSSKTCAISGTITVTCVTIVSSITPPVARPGVSWGWSVELKGVEPFTVTENTKPAWLTIAVSGKYINFNGTPPSTGVFDLDITINSCTSVPLVTQITVAAECQGYYNNTDTTYNVTYIPCGGTVPIHEDVAPGESVCGTDFSGEISFFLPLGAC